MARWITRVQTLLRTAHAREINMINGQQELDAETCCRLAAPVGFTARRSRRRRPPLSTTEGVIFDLLVEDLARMSHWYNSQPHMRDAPPHAKQLLELLLSSAEGSPKPVYHNGGEAFTSDSGLRGCRC